MKKLIGVLLVLVLLVSVAGCGKQTEQGEPKSDSTQSGEKDGKTDENKEVEPVAEKITLKIANYAILEKGYTEFWEKSKTAFEEKNPNITIEWVTAPYGEILNTVINMAGGGDKVDLMFGEMIWMPAMIEAGLAVPLENLMDKDFLADYYPEILEAFTIDGHLYSLPLYSSPSILFYNKTIFEKAGIDPNKAPTSYQEMLQMAEKISQLKTDDGNKIYAFGETTASVPVSGITLLAYTANFGGEYLNQENKLSVDNVGLKESLVTLKELNDKGYNPQNAKLKDLRNLFALGQLAMYYDNSWGFNGVKSINPAAADFTAVAVPLKGENGSGQSILQAHTFTVFDNGEDRMKAAKDFIQFMISPEVLADYMKNTTPAFAVCKSMENAINPLLEKAKAANTNLAPLPMISNLNDFALEVSGLAQAITVGGEEVDVALTNFKKTAETILNQ
ncbi:sugar ABC transporter substrate-binding protein [Clostridiales bacterium COT073_COT-073]|nr:sugar ABC transporter substrate-binding protein [Clostridiales bacterium COT073_COT-073]